MAVDGPSSSLVAHLRITSAMQFSGFVALFFLAAYAPQVQAGMLRRATNDEEGPSTAMANLEGEACGEDEYGRYKTMVCKIEKACGCADTVCKLDWCAKYVHDLKLDFGACLKKGCP